jgi:hypothetical protein
MVNTAPLPRASAAAGVVASFVEVSAVPEQEDTVPKTPAAKRLIVVSVTVMPAAQLLGAAVPSVMLALPVLGAVAAVVVGGTSLSGGRGTMPGTLIGAFIIAVINNGMNLTGVESYTQKVVLGLVILAAVMLYRIKHRFSAGRGKPQAARH